MSAQQPDDNDERYLEEQVNGNLGADIHVMNQEGGGTDDQRVALSCIYGVRYDKFSND
jgi:hypothetical protein